jgi:GNAT superfamily N-acetyltransferase
MDRQVDSVRFVEVGDDGSLEVWQRIHNEIIPTDPLTLDEVRERSTRHRLELAYAGDEPVGNSTVRRPTDDAGAMVIARVLLPYRRRGIGTRLYDRALAAAREWADGRPVETVVLASNEDGLAFALGRGFVEVERYTLPGATVPYIALALRG